MIERLSNREKIVSAFAGAVTMAVTFLAAWMTVHAADEFVKNYYEHEPQAYAKQRALLVLTGNVLCSRSGGVVVTVCRDANGKNECADVGKCED